jgi:hypothetical protein
LLKSLRLSAGFPFPQQFRRETPRIIVNQLGAVLTKPDPFAAEARVSGESAASKRGPPADAAVMWAATPTLIDPSGSS